MAAAQSIVSPANRQPFTLELIILHGRDLKKADLLTSDPYARVFIDNEYLGQTNIISRTTSPVWNFPFTVPLLHPYLVLRIELMDYDDLSQDDPLGFVELKISDLQEGVEQTHNLRVQNGEGVLCIVTKFHTQQLVKLQPAPKQVVDPSTFSEGAMEVIEAYNTPQACLDYIIETQFVTSQMYGPLLNDLLYDIHCIMLSAQTNTAALSPVYLRYPTSNRFTSRAIDVNTETPLHEATDGSKRPEAVNKRHSILSQVRERIFKNNNTPMARETLQRAFQLNDSHMSAEVGPLGAILGNTLKAGTASTSVTATGEFKFPFTLIVRTEIGDLEFVASDETNYWRWVIALTKVLNRDAPPEYTFRSILRKRRRHALASGGFEYHDRWCEIDMQERRFRYGEAETRMNKGFPVDAIRQLILSRDHHDPKQFLFSCKLAHVLIPPILSHKKKGTLSVAFQLGDETFRSSTPTSSAQSWDFGFESAISMHQVQQRKLTVSLSLKSGLEHTRLGEAQIPLAALFPSDPYSAEKPRPHMVPLSISQTQLKVTVHGANRVLAADATGLSNPYCIVTGMLKSGGTGEKYKTSVCKQTLHPIWNDEPFFFGTTRWAADDYSHIRILVRDKDRFSKDDLLGVVYVPVSDFPVEDEDEPQVFPIQRHEDMPNVAIGAALGTLRVSVQRVSVDSAIIAQATAIALQLVTKAEHCDEFSTSWPANALDSPQTVLQVGLGHDSVLVNEVKQFATPNILSCCRRLGSDALRLDVWENERFVDGTWRPSEPTAKNPYDPNFLSDETASSQLAEESLGHIEPLDGYTWTGNWELCQTTDGCDGDGWLYGSDFVRMIVNKTALTDPTVRRRLWNRVMTRHYPSKDDRNQTNSTTSTTSATSAASAATTTFPRQQRLGSGFRRKHSSTGVSNLRLRPDFDITSSKAVISWDRVEYVRVLTPSTLYVQLQSASNDYNAQLAPLELIIGPCPAQRLGALFLERKSLLGYRARLQDLFAAGEVRGDLGPVLSLLSDFSVVNTTCERLVKDLEKQPATMQEAELVRQRIVRMRLYQCLLQALHYRSDLTSENFSNYVENRIAQALQQIPGSVSGDTNAFHTVQVSIVRMRCVLDLYEQLVVECFLCGNPSRDVAIERMECTVNHVLPFILSTLAQYMGTQDTLQQLSGQQSKMKLVEFFILEDDAILKPLSTLAAQYGFTIQPAAALSGYLDFDSLLGSYTYLLEDEMKTWIRQTVRVAAINTSGSTSPGSRITLPWTVVQRADGAHQSTIPEDVMYAFQTYIEDMTQDLSVGALTTKAKNRFNAFQEKLLSAVASGLVWLAREYYEAFLKSHTWTNQHSDEDFRMAVSFLTACINDGTRILDVHVPSLEADGMCAMELDELDAEFSDMMLQTSGCIGQLLLSHNAELLSEKVWLAQWEAKTTPFALQDIIVDLRDDLRHLQDLIPGVWADKVASLCLDKLVVIYVDFLRELSHSGRGPLAEDDIDRLTAEVQFVCDTFATGPASRKAAQLQDFHALLCSPIRNGSTRGQVFWETFGRLWARSNRSASLSQFLAMCLQLRHAKPDPEDPIWFVADVANFHPTLPALGFDGAALVRAIEGDIPQRSDSFMGEHATRLELFVTVHQALDLLNVERVGKSDPYCRLRLGDQEHRTATIKNTLDPTWNENFRFALPNIIGQTLRCELWDYNRVMPHQPLGYFMVSLAGLEVTDREQWYNVVGGTGRVLLGLQLNRLDACVRAE